MTITYRNGIGTTSAYQVSGIPFTTGSTLAAAGEERISFPFVVKTTTVFNTGAESLRVHYNSSSAGNVIAGNHFITVEPSGSLTLSAKCKEIYVSSVAGTTYEMFAELTTVSTTEMYILTGSGLTD
jgi:hypothetical protein